MSTLRQAAQQALEALVAAYQGKDKTGQVTEAITALRAALAEPRPIQECYGDCPTDPATCLNSCNFEGRPKPEQKPQTTHWEGCEAVHPECRKQEPVAWVPVTEALPESGVKVLACYRNRFGNLCRIRAKWIAAKTDEAYGEGAEFCSEYDEATDTYYTTEGWYECINNWDEFTSIAVTEGDVTHWMPLPPDPDTAPTPRKPLTDEMVKRMKEVCTSMEMRGAFADGWLSAEAAHGIGEQT